MVFYLQIPYIHNKGIRNLPVFVDSFNSYQTSFQLRGITQRSTKKLEGNISQNELQNTKYKVFLSIEDP